MKEVIKAFFTLVKFLIRVLSYVILLPGRMFFFFLLAPVLVVFLIYYWAHDDGRELVSTRAELKQIIDWFKF